MWISTLRNAEEAMEMGVRIGSHLQAGTVVALYGELGAGKTTLTKGLALGWGRIAPDLVHSPTFSYLHTYEGERALHHFDLYRLPGSEAFLRMGFDDYLISDAIVCVEWPERIAEILAEILPENILVIHLSHLGDDLRRISIPCTQASELWSHSIGAKVEK